MRFASAQFHEIGIFLGGSNYIGDIGSHRYIDPNEFAYGVLYKWNVTDRYSLRSGVTFSNLNENEFRNSDINRFRRSYKVNNPIQEITAGVEINFKEFNLHDPEFSFTPYIFYGLGYFRYDQPYLISNGPIDPPSINVFSKLEIKKLIVRNFCKNSYKNSLFVSFLLIFVCLLSNLTTFEKFFSPISILLFCSLPSEF